MFCVSVSIDGIVINIVIIDVIIIVIVVIRKRVGYIERVLY